MRKRPGTSRPAARHETGRPVRRRYSIVPLVLFTLGLMVSAAVIAWAATRHGETTRPVRLAEAEGATMTVHKSPTCGCCGRWVQHMRVTGFAVQVVDRPDVATVRRANGVSESLASCHTTVLNAGGARYVLEGHVPAADVVRLLRERPTVHGIAVPGMPYGSPGMEAGVRAPYDVIGFDTSGTSRVFASH